ncbi:MAG TPA: hypothetical protein VGO17_02610 [Aurantimonas sp.]|nr:hypothetical protein [Aurantimonas sp.]
MADDDTPGSSRPTRQERLQEQLRANLRRRKEQARARREPRTDETSNGEGPSATESDKEG